MEVNGKHYRTVWMEGNAVMMIDQSLLPYEFKVYACRDYMQTSQAIKTMIIRGAGAIGSGGRICHGPGLFGGRKIFPKQPTTLEVCAPPLRTCSML
jgi:hypothetical protein